MGAPATDERLHRDALLALLGPELAGNLYDYDGVPGANGPNGTTNGGTLPSEYTTLNVERDPALVTHTSGRAHQSAWAVTFESVSSRYVDNVRNAQAKVAASLDGVRLVVDGRESTPVEFESAIAPRLDRDTKVYVGRSVYLYILS